MSLLHLLTGGGSPQVPTGDRVLSVGDWFFAATSGEGITSQNALAFPLGAPGGWRARWPERTSEMAVARKKVAVKKTVSKAAAKKSLVRKPASKNAGVAKGAKKTSNPLGWALDSTLYP